jgi:glycerol-1-phosphate dehydrogenase [NAD(P)+]
VTFDLPTVRGQLAASPDAARLAPVGLRAVIDGDGALGGLADAVAAYPAARDGVVVLADATPMTIGGDDLGAAVRDALSSRFRVGWVTVGDPAQPGPGRAPRPGPPPRPGGPAVTAVHADEKTVAAAAAAVAGAGCVVTLGSGTVTDIGKAATPAGTPLVAVQTAASVNGYADPLSVLLRQGVKRTTRTRWPDTLLIDPAVLAAAPPALNRAGVGDMMAMFTAPADWFLAGVLWPGARAAGGEPGYCAAVATLTRPHGGRLLELGAGLAADHGQLAELARLLTLSGIAMGAAGVTAPASGMEHAISHLLEMRDTARGEPGGFHGTQVGAATVIAAATWDLVRRRVDDGALCRTPRLPDPDTAREAIASTFKALDPSGAMAAECFAGYAVKLRALAAGDPLAGLRDSFDQQAKVLDELLASPGEIAAGLVAAGLPATLDGLGVDMATARWAIAASPLQRHRVSVADLALLTGGWGEAEAEEMLAVATAAAAEAAGRP